MGKEKAREFGQFLVADPKICHGQWTFKGTRILVSVVLAQVARGEPWEEMALAQWGGRITTEAVVEAVRLAREALIVTEKERWPVALSA